MFETAEESRNRIATDVECCPECESEEIDILSMDQCFDTGETVFTNKCIECGHEFVSFD